MDLTKTYEWSFDLEEYVMTKDVSEDYIAKLNTGKTYEEEDLIKDIVLERTDIRPETLRMCNQLMADKIIERLCEGHIVATQTATYVPALSGIFMGNTGIVDPAKNVCLVNISNSDALRKQLKNVTPKFSGMVRSMGGARISLVLDTATKKTDGTITPGKMLDVTGNKIRSINADGTGLGTVRFLKADTREEVATVTEFGINDPKRLMFIAPTLDEGGYILQIETYFSTSNTLLKQPRTIEYPVTLYVGERPSTGGGSGEEEEERPGGL